MDTPIVPLSSFEGYHCGYSRVVKKQADIGTVIYKHKINDISYGSYWPFLPAESNELNGKIEQQVTNNLSYVSVYAQNNTYGVISSLVPGLILKGRKFYFGDCNWAYAGGTGATEYFIGQAYNPISQIAQIQTQTTIVDNVTTTKNIEYNSTKHLFPTAEYFTDSNGKVNRTEYTYPTDLWHTAVKDELVERNIMAL